MKNYKQLQKDFDKKVENLQKKCKHKRTEWMTEWWAYAHSTGHRVRVCLTCNKIVEKD